MFGELLLAVWYLVFIAGLMVILFASLDVGCEWAKRFWAGWRK